MAEKDKSFIRPEEELEFRLSKYIPPGKVFLSYKEKIEEKITIAEPEVKKLDIKKVPEVKPTEVAEKKAKPKPKEAAVPWKETKKEVEVSKPEMKHKKAYIITSTRTYRNPVIPRNYYSFDRICRCDIGPGVSHQCKPFQSGILRAKESWKRKLKKETNFSALSPITLELQREYEKAIFARHEAMQANRSTLIYSSYLSVDWSLQEQVEPAVLTFLLFGDYEGKFDDMVWRCDIGPDIIAAFMWRLFARLPIKPRIPKDSAIIALNEEIITTGGRPVEEVFEEFEIKKYFIKMVYKFFWPSQIKQPLKAAPQPSSLVYRYNVSKKVLEKAHDMNNARVNHQAAIVSNKLYVVGGQGKDLQPLKAVEYYTSQQDTWQLVSDMDCPRFGMAVCAFENRLYVIGGITQVNGQQQLLDTVIFYDPINNRWSKIEPNFPYPCAYMTAVEHNKCIYVCGGLKNLTQLDITDAVWIYLPDQKAWFEGFHLNVPRYRAVAHSLGNKLYVFGGCGLDGERKYTNEHMLNNGLGWYEEVLLPAPISGQQIAAIKTDFMPGFGFILEGQKLR